VCLLQTSLGLRRAGLDVFVVPDACGSRRERDKALAMERLRQAGVVLASPEMVAFEWLATCAHPRFRDVLRLVKALPA
jgi:nicotinamidase-related amidase